MSNTIKKISAVPLPKGLNPNSIEGALSKFNLTRLPGTLHKKVPYRERDGRYRTGLDPDALYIKNMPEAERAQEVERVTALLNKAKSLYGDKIDLGPRSDFYAKMFDSKMGSSERAPVASLVEGTNIYNLDVPEDLIMFAYLRVHPDVADSLESVYNGKNPKARYYVNDSEVEDALAAKRKRSVNKAILLLDKLSVNKMKKVGRQLGLPFRDDTREDTVYVELDKFIKASEEGKNQGNADLFISFCEMSDENLAIRDVVKEALTYGVLKADKGGVIKRGRDVFATSEEEAIVHLGNPENIDDLTTLQESIKVKKIKAT